MSPRTGRNAFRELPDKSPESKESKSAEHSDVITKQESPKKTKVAKS